MRADFRHAQSRHRLVEQQQFRLGGERDRELKLALLAVAQGGHRDIGALFESDPGERGAPGLAEQPFLAGVAPEMEGMTVMGLRRQRDIVERGEVGKQRGDLKRARQPERAAAIRRQPGDVPAGKVHGAGMRQQLPGELADQGGLAGAVRPDDGVQFVAPDLERNIVGRGNAAEAADQVPDAEQRISHGRTSRAAP